MRGLTILSALLFCLATSVNAANSYKINSGSSADIDEFGVCAKITNNHASGKAIFVPTKTSAEWSTFRSNKPSGVTSNICCAGEIVGGYCWYLGAAGDSCTEVCASHGGYNSATLTYAGSDGTDARCNSVLEALGSSGTLTPSSACTNTCNVGCMIHINATRYRITTNPTIEGSSYANYKRACACNK